MTEDNPADRRPGGLLAMALLLVAVVVAAHATTYFLNRKRLDELEERIAAVTAASENVERAVQLFRMERGSGGLGVNAILDQLRFWAPLLSSGTTPSHELPRVQQHVTDAVAALADLGKEAYPALLEAFLELRSGKDDELRRQLLKAIVTVDRERGLDLLERCIRGWDVHASPRLRIAAAQELMLLDQERVGAVLIEVLSYDSAAGVQMHRLTPDQQKRFLAAKPKTGRMPTFFTFVDILANSGVDEAEATMVMIAGRPEHDLATVQACVKRLGEARSKIGLKLIKKLFDAPPEIRVNPLFQNHCLDAIAKIAGTDACAFFKEALLKGYDPRVQAKLTELIKETCS